MNDARHHLADAVMVLKSLETHIKVAEDLDQSKEPH